MTNVMLCDTTIVQHCIHVYNRANTSHEGSYDTACFIPVLGALDTANGWHRTLQQEPQHRMLHCGGDGRVPLGESVNVLIGIAPTGMHTHMHTLTLVQASPSGSSPKDSYVHCDESLAPGSHTHEHKHLQTCM